MSTFENAAWVVHQVLTKLGLAYAIIGGTAVQYWGEPRFTQDIDLTILAPFENLPSTLQEILAQLPPRMDNALDFALEKRVLLVQTPEGVPVDISLGLPGYEEEVMERTIEYEMVPGQVIRLCSAEDLIIHKAVAGRPQDVRDIENIISRQRDKLDEEYIRHWLQAFADILETAEVLERFERPYRKLLADN